MRRLISSLILAGVLSLSFVGGSALAQFPNNPGNQPAQQYTKLNEQSLPQLLQQAGYQVQNMQVGPGVSGWKVHFQPNTGPLEITLLKNKQGQVAGLDFVCGLKQIPNGNLTPATMLQLLQTNHNIVPYAFSYNSMTNMICLNWQFHMNDSNPQELRTLISNFANKVNQYQHVWNVAFQPVPNPVPPVPMNPDPIDLTPITLTPVVPLKPDPIDLTPVVPVVNPNPLPPLPVANLANTTWVGQENISGNWTSLTFRFLPGGQATMTTSTATYTGTWSKDGNQVNVQYPTINTTFQGTLVNNTITGQGKDSIGPWSFTVSLK